MREELSKGDVLGFSAEEKDHGRILRVRVCHLPDDVLCAVSVMKMGFFSNGERKPSVVVTRIHDFQKVNFRKRCRRRSEGRARALRTMPILSRFPETLKIDERDLLLEGRAW